MADSGSNKRVANSLVALSSAAVLAVYAAGYERTKAAANRFAVQAEERRPASVPSPVVPATNQSESGLRPEAPTKAEEPAKIVRPRTTPRPEAKKAAAEPTTATPIQAPSAQIVEPPPVVVALPEPPPPPPAPAKPVYKDGTYLGWGTSRHGDIQAQVVIEDGRIKAATIAQCLTRYSCNVISNLPPQVAQRQSPETDYVSGATQSTNAFYFAVVEALSKAK